MANNPPAPPPESDKPAETDSKKAENATAIGPIAISIEVPVAPNHQAKASQRQGWWSRCFYHIKQNGLGVISAVTAIVAAIYAYKQADVADKALNLGQRAFVHLEGIDESIADNWVIDVESNPKITVWNAPRNEGKMIHSKFSLTNSGNTPTKALQIMLHCQLVGPPFGQAIKDPFDLLKWDDAVVIHRSIGAHHTIGVSGDRCDFKNSDVLLNAQMTIVPVFLIGDVKYEDWIKPGITHRTQFAHRLIVHEVGTMPGFEGMGVTTEPIGKHNCTDEDCPADKLTFRFLPG
jgi:hypothetical protein